MEAVANRVETAVRMQQVTKSMAGVVQGMDQALKNMDLEQISQLMDRFDKTFEDLDVQAQTMEQSMSSAGAVSTPVDQVDNLIQVRERELIRDKKDDWDVCDRKKKDCDMWGRLID